MDYRDRLSKIGEKFNINLTPDNVDDVLRDTWQKYHRSVKKPK